MSQLHSQRPESLSEEKFKEATDLKIDGSGLPLVPQPTESPLDPLNYPNWLKYTILLQVSLLAFLATLNVAIINPAVVPLATEFNIPHVTATYQTTVAIGTSALGPLLFTPFANVYGRRPVYLISILIGFASALGSAKATSFGTLVVARAINGFGPSAALGLGAGTVVDLFFVHQRGKTMGFFTLMSTNGAHLAPIIGGYVARARGWRWCFFVGAILNGIMFVFAFFLMPETVFDRPTEGATDGDFVERITKGTSKGGEDSVAPVAGVPYVPPSIDSQTYFRRLWFWDLDRPAIRRLKATDFVIKPLSMLKYPSVAFPALYYAITYGFASIEPALILATIFTKLYRFDTVHNGLANGVSLLVGASLGELCSGPVTDRMMFHARQRAFERGETASPEVRLQGIWTGTITVPIGLIIWCDDPFCHDFHCSMYWHGRGLLWQLSPQSAIHIAVVIVIVLEAMMLANVSSTFFRQIFGLTLGFYSIPFGDKIGFQWSFTFFAVICLISFLPVITLMYRGEKWRKSLGEPTSY